MVYGFKFPMSNRWFQGIHRFENGNVFVRPIEQLPSSFSSYDFDG